MAQQHALDNLEKYPALCPPGVFDDAVESLSDFQDVRVVKKDIVQLRIFPLTKREWEMNAEGKVAKKGRHSHGCKMAKDKRTYTLPAIRAGKYAQAALLCLVDGIMRLLRAVPGKEREWVL